MKTRDEYLHDSVPQLYRGKYRKAWEGKSAMDAIRAKCLDCMAWQAAEVTRCPCTNCPIWEYRFGCSPRARKRSGAPTSPESVV